MVVIFPGWKNNMNKNKSTIKILGVNGSPHETVTAYCVKEALAAASEIPGVETEYLSLAGLRINHCDGCKACRRYYQKKGLDRFYCSKKDDMQTILGTFFSADAFIIGTPVCEMNVPGLLKDFIDRFNCLFPMDRQAKPYAVGGAISVSEIRRGGHESALEAVLDFYTSWQILLCGGPAGRGASVWCADNDLDGLLKDDVELTDVRTLGRQIANTASMGAKGYHYLLENRDL
jgi:multimeric flavodoxin WrbA